MRSIAKAVFALTPYRVVRQLSANRFQAIEPCLNQLCARGYDTRLIIDGGAHLGSFSVEAAKHFPSAQFHLIEPQPACRKPLESLCQAMGFKLHSCALADADGEVVISESSEPSTGVHVSQQGGVSVPACTLDSLFTTAPASGERALLKLDLQGYELRALRGATRVLSSIEVIITEVSFFQQAYEPTIAELVAFLAERDFILYDVASLSGRARDNRLKQGDFVFARKDSALLADRRWA